MPRVHDEGGHTLVEVLVATVAGVVLLGGVMTAVLVAVRSEAVNSNRGVKVEQLDVTLERLTSEAREATSASYIAGSAGRAITLQPGSVVWDCRLSANTVCGRREGAGATHVLVTGVVNSDVLRLGCRDSTTGDLVTMVPDAAAPVACSGSPASNVDVRFVARPDCGGETRQDCPNRDVELRGGVSLRNVG